MKQIPITNLSTQEAPPAHDSPRVGRFKNRAIIQEDSLLLNLPTELLTIAILRRIVLQESWTGVAGFASSSQSTLNFMRKVREHPDFKLAYEAAQRGLWRRGSFQDAVKTLLNKGKVKECYKLMELAGGDKTYGLCAFSLREWKKTVTTVDRAGLTLLHYAVEAGNGNLCGWLLLWGANIEIADHNGVRPLHLAACKGDVNVVNLILQKNALIEAQDNKGRRALHLAALFGHQGVLELLLQHKAVINAVDDEDKTALNYAAEGWFLEIVEMLTAAGPQEW